MPKVRIELPFHLRTLAGVGEFVEVDTSGPATLSSALDALENRHPMLRGTIRDHVTKARRPFIRIFACRRDFSHDSPVTLLPEAVASGQEPLRIVGAIAGG